MLELVLGEVSELCREARALGRAALSDAEWRRCDGMAAPRRREQFVAGHWLARRSLARLLGPCSAVPEIAMEEGGAPHLPQHPDVFLSLSHSGNVVGCALASAPVGIDLECLARVVDIAAAAPLVCAAAERELLAAQERANAGFLQLWSLKEAWFKSRHRPMWLHAMRGAHVRPALATEHANALSGFDRGRDVVVSVVAAPALLANRGAGWPLTTTSRWQVEETHADAR